MDRSLIHSDSHGAKRTVSVKANPATSSGTEEAEPSESLTALGHQPTASCLLRCWGLTMMQTQASVSTFSHTLTALLIPRGAMSYHRHVLSHTQDPFAPQLFYYSFLGKPTYFNPALFLTCHDRDWGKTQNPTTGFTLNS